MIGTEYAVVAPIEGLETWFVVDGFFNKEVLVLLDKPAELK